MRWNNNRMSYLCKGPQPRRYWVELTTGKEQITSILEQFGCKTVDFMADNPRYRGMAVGRTIVVRGVPTQPRGPQDAQKWVPIG